MGIAVLVVTSTMHVAHLLWGARLYSFNTLGRSITAILLLLMGGSTPELDVNSGETNMDRGLIQVLLMVLYIITLVLPAAVCGTTVYYFFHPHKPRHPTNPPAM